MVNSETTTFASIFRFRLTETGQHFAATRHIPWALNTPKMCLRPVLGCKHIFVHLAASPGERVWWLQMSFFPLGGANSAPPNTLAGFEGPLRGGRGKRGKGRKRERNKEEMKGTEGTGENTPRRPPPAKQISGYHLVHTVVPFHHTLYKVQ